ncbi:MAG: PadR family transcriptional regulator [Hyphomicrobiales bacterium]|nr:MAG: PadR family transcriptional regulator [Hyphomicrobiales bacterium]
MRHGRNQHEKGPGGRHQHGHGGRAGRGHGRGSEEIFGERRRHGRRVLTSDDLRLVVLKLVAEEPRHGYDLIRAIEEASQGVYAPSPGVIYPALSVLQDMGLIEEVDSSGPRKVFTTTEKATAELETNAETVRRLFDRLATLGGRIGERDINPIFRAMDNLKAALRARIEDDDTTRDTVHEVAAIIDETAQRIERL